MSAGVCWLFFGARFAGRWRLRFLPNGLLVPPSPEADVAELADALDSKSSTGNSVWVRSPPSALSRTYISYSRLGLSRQNKIYRVDRDSYANQYSWDFGLRTDKAAKDVVREQIPVLFKRKKIKDCLLPLRQLRKRASVRKTPKAEQTESYFAR
jgi:hypothetical protein